MNGFQIPCGGLLQACVAFACLTAVVRGQAVDAGIPEKEIQSDPRSWLLLLPEKTHAEAWPDGLFYERWNNVAGVTVRDLLHAPAFSKAPDVVGIAPSMTLPSGDGRDFGVRMRGHLVAPRDGMVRFAVSSDANSELWFSQNDSHFSRRKIAWITGPGWLSANEPGKLDHVPTQWSAPVKVTKGGSHYIEIYHKEETFDDHFELLWQFEEDAQPSVVPGEILRPWMGSPEDVDGDGLPDRWQKETGLSSRDDRAWWQDADGDLVSNFEEFFCRTNPMDGGPLDGFVLLETWYGAMGKSVDELRQNKRFLLPAHEATFIQSAGAREIPYGLLGSRASGYLVPAETGVYELAIRGKDSVELWLSTGESKLLRRRVAFSDYFRMSEAKVPWGGSPSQTSAPVELEAGKAYYFEILQKNGEAPGHSSLGWRKAGEKAFAAVLPQFLRSPSSERDVADADGDGLPDKWVATARAAAGAQVQGVLSDFDDADGDGLVNLLEHQIGGDLFGRNAVSGSLSREWWFQIPGVSVFTARDQGAFLKRPQMFTLTTGAVSEIDTVDTFASRLRGSVTAPVSGEYRFWISGDDHCELWLSDNETKFYKRNIAKVAPSGWERQDSDAWTNPGQWDKRSSQESATIFLKAGETRFLEILHKDGTGPDHVAVAWQYRETAGEWAPRELIPAEALTSYAGDDNDLDDDYLPDDWETEKGLDPGDNGLKDPTKQGENGDFDGDGLTNRDEFLLGTSPANLDSDGDGAGDLDEIRLYYSDPTKKDVVPPVEYARIPLRNFKATAGDWFVSSDGTIFSMSRSQPVVFEFEVDEPGIYVVELDARVRSADDYKPAVTVEVHVNEDRIGSAEIRGEWAQRKWHTQWLECGLHTVTIDNGNIRAGVGLEIRSLLLSCYEKDALDVNSVPVWMAKMLREANRIESGWSESAVSPAFVEGISRIEGDVDIVASGNSVEVKPGLAGAWYADVPLLPEGPTPVTALFERGTVESEGTIRWSDTNVNDEGVFRVRTGDSLKFISYLGGTDGNTLKEGALSLDGTSLEGDPCREAVVVTFGRAGLHVIQSVARDPLGNLVRSSVEVQAVSADFGPVVDLIDRTPRIWALPDVSRDVFLEADEQIVVNEINTAHPAPRELEISYLGGRSSPRILARLSEGGPVVAMTTFNAAKLFAATETGEAKVIEVLPDGTQVVEVGFLLQGEFSPDFSIWIDMFVPNAVFESGETRYQLTADDFDENGMARVRIYAVPNSNGVTKVCHWINAAFVEEPKN